MKNNREGDVNEKWKTTPNTSKGGTFQEKNILQAAT